MDITSSSFVKSLMETVAFPAEDIVIVINKVYNMIDCTKFFMWDKNFSLIYFLLGKSLGHGQTGWCNSYSTDGSKEMNNASIIYLI